MYKLTKQALSFIFEITLVLVFWVNFIILMVVLFEYLGEKIHTYITRDRSFKTEEIIAEVERVYPSGEFSFVEHGSFERGNLTGWAASGEAFQFQPTFEDNPIFRGIPINTNISGKFWIGTFEKRPDKSYVRGAVQGDEFIGTLTSKEFLITKPILSFLIGGGKGPNTRTELLIEGKEKLYRTGNNSETMRRVRLDVSKYRGKKARICLVDYSKGSWGHINFDDLRLEDDL